jgi:hypothetical protein
VRDHAADQQLVDVRVGCRSLSGFTLHRNVLHRASIAIPIMGLALHQHTLCRLSLAWLGFHAELSV